jgi:DNA polymerase kappa
MESPNDWEAQVDPMSMQNKPNGQFKLEFDAQVIKDFMKDLSIRKVPGIGRVRERLLESIDVKVRSFSTSLCPQEWS